MDGHDEDLVDVDPYDDGSFPEFRWKRAPQGLATRRQLRVMGLRPGGQEPVARITCRRGQRFAYLYRVDLAKPIRPMTLAKELALDKAMAARQTCPKCRRRYHVCLKRAILHPMQHTTSAMKGLLPARTALYVAALG
ncbi:RRQRL motif-containing zinc-binding protein [Streptomyces collinus]|uniref:RRQRL motif-containing zinc-binding protein n=1 Tax=Streptomyces collinus TaxID=42684 RepID=UPI0034321BB7